MNQSRLGLFWIYQFCDHSTKAPGTGLGRNQPAQRIIVFGQGLDRFFILPRRSGSDRQSGSDLQTC